MFKYHRLYWEDFDFIFNKIDFLLRKEEYFLDKLEISDSYD